jgi:hypothetical protein
MPKIPYNQVSSDAKRKLEEFLEEFNAALAVMPPEERWSEQLGLYVSSDAIKLTFPVPISAAGYVRREGDDRLRSLYARSMSMKLEEWTDGIEELASIIEAPDFLDWIGEPARMAVETNRHGNTLVAAMLEANPNLDFYKDPDNGITTSRALFAATHPFNIFDPDSSTFDNDQTGTAIDATLVKAVKQRFRARKGPNGQPMGLRADTCIVPAARQEEAEDFFKQDMLIESIENVALDGIAAVTRNNRHKGMRLIVADELTNDDMIYFMDSRATAPKPWVLQEAPSVEELIKDKTSDHYFNTGKVAMKLVRKAAAAAALPHAIERVDLS